MKSLKSKIKLGNFLNLWPLILVFFLLFSMPILNQESHQSIKLTAQCGGGSGYSAVPTSINFGCSQKGNPITDLLFAVIRFLSAGVGLVIIASVIVGGIQYIVARGDPNGTQAAVKRLISSTIALLVFIFAYAILNYVVPGGFLHP